MAGITWVSRSEVRPDQTRNPGVILGVNLEGLALAGLAVVCLVPGGRFNPTFLYVRGRELAGLAGGGGVGRGLGKRWRGQLFFPA